MLIYGLPTKALLSIILAAQTGCSASVCRWNAAGAGFFSSHRRWLKMRQWSAGPSRLFRRRSMTRSNMNLFYYKLFSFLSSH